MAHRRLIVDIQALDRGNRMTLDQADGINDQSQGELASSKPAYICGQPA